ncbi:MAG: hypothetical protein KME43_27180 [Myxacorys chilensis ATA2-1-KO14]|nr:hypothetical protein [Myxacorys chilensis ATA2-1-KO14]
MPIDRLNQWQETLSNRESVRSIAKPPEFYLEHYGKLLRSESYTSVTR